MYLKMWKWKDPMDGWIDLIATTAQVEWIIMDKLGSDNCGLPRATMTTIFNIAEILSIWH
jgi:hypothetical protein